MRKVSETENTIIQKAKEYIISSNNTSISLAEIAEKIDFKRPTIQYYFPTIEFLIERVCDEVVCEFKQKITQIISVNSAIDVNIKKVIEIFFDTIMQSSQLFVFIFTYQNKSSKTKYADDTLNILYNFEIFEKLLSDEYSKGNIKYTEPSDFFITLMSLTAYPFTIKKIIQARHCLSDTAFNEFILKRKVKITEIMLATLKVN